MIHKVNEDTFFNHELPVQTQSYTPVSNRLLNDLIYQEAEKRNYIITGKGFRANPSLTEFIAMFTLNQPEDGLIRMIGYRNSTNKKWSVGFVAGALVTICSNGMVSGDIITFRKHTGSVKQDLNFIIQRAFEEITPRFDTIKQQTEHLQKKLIQKSAALDIIAELFFTERLLNITQMAVLRENLFSDHNFSLPENPSEFFFSMDTLQPDY